MDSSYIPSGELAWLSFIWVWKDELAHSIFNSSFDCLQHVRLDTKSELNDPQETSIRRRLYFNYRLLKFGFFFPLLLPPLPSPLPISDVQPQISRGIETTLLPGQGETPLSAMQV